MNSKTIEERWGLGADDWKGWEPQDEKRSAFAAPQSAGVYLFRAVEPPAIPRACGQSDIAYIGSAPRKGLQGRLIDHASERIEVDVGRRIRRLRDKYQLQVAWKAFDDPRSEESHLLLLYELDHYELPPCNRARKDFHRDVLLYAGFAARNCALAT